MNRQCRFDNYIEQPPALVTDSLKALVNGDGERQIALWGDSGKTHLVNATVQLARDSGLQAQLYDGLQLMNLDADAFEGWQQADLLAVDNLDAIAGNLSWEQHFYGVMNAVRDGRPGFVFTLSVQPNNVSAQLADFKSRLTWGLQLKLASPDDDLLSTILRQRAHLMGITLGNDVVNYLLTHVSRRIDDQLAVLHELEQVSLAEKRRVTVPLVRQVLSAYQQD